MIVYEGSGNLFDLPEDQRDIQTLVNPVNTVGIMGKGLALAFKHRCHSLFPRYRAALKAGDLTIKKPWLSGPYHGKMVLCFATKEHWVDPSKPEYLVDGLTYLVKHWKAMGITSMAMPALGCGNGGLSYGKVVRPLLKHFLTEIELPVSLFLNRDQLREF